jgi:hypothetical protein
MVRFLSISGEGVGLSFRGRGFRMKCRDHDGAEYGRSIELKKPGNIEMTVQHGFTIGPPAWIA